jgi:hypothetical protein
MTETSTTTIRVDLQAPQYRLYRWFDSDDVLLYIGVTCRPELRASAHSLHSYWSRFAKRCEYDRQTTESRVEGLDWERQAIQNDRPVFNMSPRAPGALKAQREYLTAHGIDFATTSYGREPNHPDLTSLNRPLDAPRTEFVVVHLHPEELALIAGVITTEEVTVEEWIRGRAMAQAKTKRLSMNYAARMERERQEKVVRLARRRAAAEARKKAAHD